MVNLIDYRNNIILRVDFNGVLTLTGALDLANKAYTLVKTNRIGNMLVLYVIGDFIMKKEFVAEAIKLFQKSFAADRNKVKRRAIVTKDDSQKDFLRMFVQKMNITHNTEYFLDEESAKKYLIGDFGESTLVLPDKK